MHDFDAKFIEEALWKGYVTPAQIKAAKARKTRQQLLLSYKNPTVSSYSFLSRKNGVGLLAIGLLAMFLVYLKRRKYNSDSQFKLAQ